MAGNDRAEAGDRQTGLDSVLAAIPGHINKLVTPENYPGLLKVMAQFHNFSFRNAVLIAAQCRKDRMFLAGRKTWERKYSRRVKSGEKGISVILPAPYRKRPEQAAGSRNAGAAAWIWTGCVPAWKLCAVLRPPSFTAWRWRCSGCRKRDAAWTGAGQYRKWMRTAGL